MTNYKKYTYILIVIMLSLVSIYYIGYNNDVNKVDNKTYITDNPYNDLFFGNFMSVPNDIYYQDWIIIFEDGLTYDKYNTKLITNNLTNSTLIQFPSILPEQNAHIYYDKITNLSNEWYESNYTTRRIIVFDYDEEREILDNFEEDVNTNWSNSL